MADEHNDQPASTHDTASGTERDRMGIAPHAKADSDLIIVGIGASAGGLEALKELIAELPHSDRLSYVVAQHLSPTHNSLLMELLTPGAPIAVRDLTDGQVPAAETIYVAPPNYHVEYTDGRLRLLRPQGGVGPKPSVDQMLRSLADNHGENTIAIILSGTGSDGAIGVRSVKAAGGIVLVQDPTSAKYDGMPRSSINTGCADRVQRPPEMGQILENIANSPNALRMQTVNDDDRTGGLERVTRLLKRATGMDLSNYKRATVNRRVQRRMNIHKVTELDAYASLLQRDKSEPAHLARDLLISVTEFFRDRESFDALNEALGELVARRSSDEVIRVWIPACATGEEPYSIAMMLAEHIRQRRDAPEFLIFASDIETDGLASARMGAYSEPALVNVGEELRKRYFTREGNLWVINKSLRQSIVFATQNVIDDPPFRRMDLISCRNLLIYFENKVQKRVLELFHYSLNHNGLLFLGKSESIELHADLYQPILRRARLFRKRNAIQGYALPIAARPGVATGIAEPDTAAMSSDRRRSTRGSRMTRAVLEKYCPPVVVVDGSDRVVHTAGAFQDFIRIPVGEVDLTIYEMVDPKMRAELRALLHRVRREKEPVIGSQMRMGDDETPVRMNIQPLTIDGEVVVMIGFDLVTVRLNVVDGQPAITPTENLIISELEQELANTRLHLQTVVEELETSNEELQSHSEELQSANEELQSTNEELQTSNEELQSTNEELTTVNDELQIKSTELEEMASTLYSLKESLSSPLILVNKRLEIQVVNAAADAILDREEATPNKSISSVSWRMDFMPALSLARQVLDSGDVQQEVVQCGDASYLLTASPHRSGDQPLLGVVLAFVDISERIASEQEIRRQSDELSAEKLRIETTLKSIGDGVITTDAKGRVTYMNPKACDLTGWETDEAYGALISDVYRAVEAMADGPDKHIALRCLEAGEPVNSNLEAPVIIGRSGRRLVVAESAAPLREPGGSALAGIVLVFRDVTDEQLLSQELSFRAAHDPLTHLVNRYEFERRVLSAVHSANRSDTVHAVAYIDLDNFKIINDTGGHGAGDKLLKQLSVELAQSIRKVDTLARLGGDEFGALLMNCPLEFAADLAEKLRLSVEQMRFDHKGTRIQITASIGVIEIRSGMGATEIMSLVDAACYAAKEAGKNRIYVAKSDDPRLAEKSGEMELVYDIGDALEKKRFRLHVEDVVGIGDASRNPRYQEVLLRVLDRDQRLRGPEALVSAGERYHLMAKIDRWVFDTLTDWLAHEDNSGNGVVWAINVSGQSLGDAGYRDHVEFVLEEHKAIAPQLCFEITETTAIARLSDVAPFVTRIKELGCKVALDDFGTGMSSLSYLKNLDIDFIKIDGGFVRDILDSKIDQAMVQAVCTVAQDLGIETIAEHVENEDTLTKLAQLGVDLAQGFVFGRGAPFPAHAVAAEDAEPDSSAA